VVLWEIYSFGSQPYPSVAVEQLYDSLTAGYRMSPPVHASPDMSVFTHKLSFRVSMCMRERVIVCVCVCAFQSHFTHLKKN
jgi:hypothetical protein